jgi:hypothetical protein
MNKTSLNKEAVLSQTGVPGDLRLSPHFTLRELTKTRYHTLDGNIPSLAAIENLKRICGWLEILRERYNTVYGEKEGRREGVRSQETGVSRNDGEIPIIINSGFRSEEVNRKCGGAKGSNHLTGCAVDIHCYGPEQMIRYACLLLDTADENGWAFDELILEQCGTTRWIHFAVRPKDNRRKILFDCR